MNMSYRKDIDGLRAISVLSILFNHTIIDLLPGGYIGVDVFFVISGYLITSIIIKEIQSNEFSLIKFYERRIRRILPALFIVMFFAFVASALVYDAERFQGFGKSMMATALFASNINFWKESGYFDAPSQQKPLLHTWSLAVEEQFYILFPLFIFALYRYARKLFPFIFATLTILSFGYAIFVTPNDSTAAFYLAHMRVWELLVGSLLAINLLPPGLGDRYRNIIGVSGLAAITIPFFLYTESTRFPGISALPPVLGTAMVIFSGTDGKSLVSKLLSFPPLVFIGKISYSLYLWHWPLIIFARYYAIRELKSGEILLLITAIIMISTLSWWFVETPFRSKNLISTRQVYLFAASGTTLMLLVGGSIFYFKGFPNRAGLEILTGKDTENETWRFTECNINYTDNIPKVITPCLIGKKSLPPSFMVVGDSHAPTYGKAIYSSAEENDVSGVLTYAQACPTLLDMLPKPESGDISCAQYNHMVFSYLEEHPEIQTVILASRWTLVLEGNGYKLEDHPTVYLEDVLHEAPPNSTEEDLFILGLERTIKALTELGRTTIVIAPLPEIGYDVPSANFIASRTGRDINELIAPSLEEYFARNQKTFEILRSFEEKYGIQIIEPWKVLCTADKCRAAINQIPLYRDDDHLSIFGSEMIKPVFDPLFKSMKQSEQ